MEEKYGGLDIPSNIVVICPLCPAKIHYGGADAKLQVYKIIKSKGIYTDFRALKDKGIISEEIFNALEESS